MTSDRLPANFCMDTFLLVIRPNETTDLPQYPDDGGGPDGGATQLDSDASFSFGPLFPIVSP
jgi:hypothetical protein